MLAFSFFRRCVLHMRLPPIPPTRVYLAYQNFERYLALASILCSNPRVSELLLSIQLLLRLRRHARGPSQSIVG